MDPQAIHPIVDNSLRVKDIRIENPTITNVRAPFKDIASRNSVSTKVTTSFTYQNPLDDKNKSHRKVVISSLIS